MSLEIIKELNIDFHNTKYIQVNAKQCDDLSRYIAVTCYNQGTVFPIDNVYNYAYIRYRKSDDLSVFNCCNITEDGKILIELTRQMLAVDGKCYADVIIVHNEQIEPDSIKINTGKLLSNENTSILSTMLFCINIIGTALDNNDIESSEEFGALNDLLIKATTDYEYVMTACKVSEDNAKESEINAKTSEDNAEMSELNAKTSEDNAKDSESNAKDSENNASISEANAKTSEEKAKTSEENAKDSETNAKESEIKAKEAVNEAESKVVEAENWAIESADSAEIAAKKAEEVTSYATLSQSYAVGGTNTRENEDLDNAKYYYSQTKTIQDTLEESVDMILNEMHLAVIDDDNGNVEIIYSSQIDGNTITEMEKMIIALQSRIEVLEDQNVLEIVE